MLLLATSAFVLLIACANVANLTLVRLVHRRAELVVRAALGAGTGRLARQLLTESVVVATAGAIVGVGLAAGLLRVLVPYAARFTPRAFEIGLDAPVLLFTLGVSVVVGLASGTLPLVAVTRDLASGLRARGDGGQARGRRGRAERCARRRAGGCVGRAARRRGTRRAQHDRARVASTRATSPSRC